MHHCTKLTTAEMHRHEIPRICSNGCPAGFNSQCRPSQKGTPKWQAQSPWAGLSNAGYLMTNQRVTVLANGRTSYSMSASQRCWRQWHWNWLLPVNAIFCSKCLYFLEKATQCAVDIVNWRAPWKNRTSRYILFSAHHSMVFYFQCSVYWWKGRIRF